ncbi:alpha/beta fold hydrolase [Kutzneria sp. NPDC052558]|uniref:alpha/beta fold hydrolase n=1 Tax=Kutzneria sp. NPDC052558 TaxID=3364121 RepID=UPI0037CA9CD2
MGEFRSFDGLRIAYQELGEGRPVVLLHGVMGLGSQWIDQGPARMIADSGFRVILPDLRGHGASDRPHDPAAYPPDVLADDGLALVEHLGLDDYDLGGYSLGGRVTLRMLARGARPRRAVIAGQGLDVLEGVTSRTGGIKGTLAAIVNGGELDAAARQTAYWLEQVGADPHALVHVPDTHVATPVEALREIQAPTLVAIGDADHARAAADQLAAALPVSRFVRLPGDHWTAFTSPEFGTAIVDWIRNLSPM